MFMIMLQVINHLSIKPKKCETVRTEKDVVFKNNAPFRSCISQFNNTLIDNSDLDTIMLMYNLLEYSQN